MSATEYKDKGNTKFQAGEFEEAVELYSKAIALDPKEPTYYANRAAARFSLKQLNESLDDCNAAIALDPKYSKAYFRRSKAYLGLGEIFKAQRDVEYTLEIEPKNTQAKQQLKEIQDLKDMLASGANHISNSDYDRALFCFKSVLEKSQECVEAKLGFGEALVGLKQYANASSVIVGVLQKDSENVKALFLRATCQYHLGHLSAAATLLGNIVRLDPDNNKASVLLKKCRRLDTLKQQADDAFRAESAEEAISLYTQALDDNPPSPVACPLYANRAAALKKVGKHEEAVKDLNMAIELDNEYVKAYIRRAQCNAQLGRYSDAIRDYEWVLQKDPQNREISAALREAKRLRKIAERKDYYKMLEVPQNATEHEIKKAYKKLAVKLHPDKHPPELRDEMEKQFKELNEAYGVLSDEQKRQRYDAGADLEEIEQGGGFHGHGGMDDIFSSMFFSPRGPRGGHSHGGFNFHFG